jgi:hypothetical protein
MAVAILVVLSGRAHAIENETFGVLPHPHNVENQERRTFVIPLEPGALFEDSIRVYNRTDQPLNLIVYPADAETGVDDTVSVGFRGAKPQGIASWVDLSKDSMTLPPGGDTLVRFRIEVRSSDPRPDLGAIVVENAERGIATDLAQRLHITIRTSPPNSPTTSVRVRPLLLRSPWIIIATIGLIVALVIVWLGARRARRPKDAVVPSGDLREVQTEEDEATAASRPVLRRLGESQKASPNARRRQPTTRTRASRASSSRSNSEPDSRPMLDDLLAEVDETEEPAPRPAKRKPAKRQSGRSAKSGASRSRNEKPRDKSGKFIPLDDL